LTYQISGAAGDRGNPVELSPAPWGDEPAAEACRAIYLRITNLAVDRSPRVVKLNDTVSNLCDEGVTLGDGLGLIRKYQALGVDLKA
jgi:hypothetical protein